MTVEFWPGWVVVLASGVPDERAIVLDDEDRRILEEWATERIHGRHLATQDDVGAAYRMDSAAVGDTGPGWRGESLFRPGAPSDATELTVDPGNVRNGTAVTVAIPRQ